MDEEDHGHEFFRPNTNHQVPINIVPSTPTPTYSTNIVSPSSMFRGPVLLLDHQDHDHDHHIHDDDNKLLRFQRNKAIDDQSNHMIMKTQIANHPAYPDLLAAYIQCKKVGAPPETASVLEEIGRSENHMMMMSSTLGLGGCSTQAGADPELDYFMESYCEVLRRFKEELSKPLNEATTFLSNIESQLSNLCEGTLITKTLDYYDQSGGSNISDHDHHKDENEEMMVIRSYGDQVAHDHHENSCGVGAGTGDYYYQQGLKEKLLRKYSGYLTMLKTEFLKKRKKVELPKPARNILLHWWNSHSRWPYPTEEEKAKLSAETGLDQKQINNWFVNQRKRHWKPTEDIKSALVNDPSA